MPGLAKTLLIKKLAEAVHLRFNRIQFTPDLMPSDILGAEVIEEDRATGKRVIRFIRGPIFANIILADEINRTPPKTQAALLEAMQEYQVTVSGVRYDLERPLFVLATQNPIEQEGTYPLPEAQLDRFMFNVVIDYPSADEERRILSMTTGTEEARIDAVASGEEIERLHTVVRDVPAADNVDRLRRAPGARDAAGRRGGARVRPEVGALGRRPARRPGAAARRQGARAARGAHRRRVRGRRGGRAAGPAAPRARELPGRGRRHRRGRDRPAAARRRDAADAGPGRRSRRSPTSSSSRSVVVDGTISGLHRSPFHGYSAEFSQYRHYRPGDDLKYVDWKLFARTDRLYTKQFRETTNLLCQIALDASASMEYAGADGVTKFQYARLLAGAWRTWCRGRETPSAWSPTPTAFGTTCRAAAGRCTCGRCSWQSARARRRRARPTPRRRARADDRSPEAAADCLSSSPISTTSAIWSSGR